MCSSTVAHLQQPDATAQRRALLLLLLKVTRFLGLEAQHGQHPAVGGQLRWRPARGQARKVGNRAHLEEPPPAREHLLGQRRRALKQGIHLHQRKDRHHGPGPRERRLVRCGPAAVVPEEDEDVLQRELAVPAGGDGRGRPERKQPCRLPVRPEHQHRVPAALRRRRRRQGPHGRQHLRIVGSGERVEARFEAGCGLRHPGELATEALGVHGPDVATRPAPLLALPQHCCDGLHF